MTEKKKEIGFWHGAFADSYEKQANEQGYTLGNNAKHFDEIAHAYNMLRLHDYLTESQAESIRNKIQKKLVNNIKPLAKEN